LYFSAVNAPSRFLPKDHDRQQFAVCPVRTICATAQYPSMRTSQTMAGLPFELKTILAGYRELPIGTSIASVLSVNDDCRSRVATANAG
jgi:hypothetical protein